jgi:hypothetical protein
MACHALGMTSAGNRATVLRTDQGIGILEPRLIICYNSFKMIFFQPRVEFVAFLLMSQHKKLFGRGTENGAPSAARIFSIPGLFEKFPYSSTR